MYGATAGQVGLLKFEASTNQAICGILPNSKIHPEYLYRILKYKTEYLVSISSGGAQPNISQAIIRQLQIPLPPLEIQRQIVEEIEACQRIINGARQVVEAWKPNLELELEEEHKSAGVEAWPVVHLGDVSEIIPGQSPDGEYYNDKGDGLPFYQGKTEFTERYLGAPKKWTTQITKIAEKNDILISVRAPVGPVNIATQKICIGRGLAAIRPDNSRLLMEFLFTTLRLKETEIIGTAGAVFPSINRGDIAKIRIVIPPLEIQQAIVARIEAEREIIEGNKRLSEIYQAKVKQVIKGVWEE